MEPGTDLEITMRNHRQAPLTEEQAEKLDRYWIVPKRNARGFFTLGPAGRDRYATEEEAKIADAHEVAAAQQEK